MITLEISYLIEYKKVSADTLCGNSRHYIFNALWQNHCILAQDNGRIG